MRNFIDKVVNAPVVAHILAALDRYNNRLGPQFAAAATYFTILSLVPILMLSFAALGLTLTVLRPELLTEIQGAVVGQLGEGDLARNISKVIEDALNNWRGVLGLALVTAAYSGSNWVGNLKRAVRVMWYDKFSDASAKKNFFLEFAINLAIFLGVLMCVVVGVVVAQVGNAFSREVVEFLGWQDIPGIGLLWGALTVGVTFLVSWILFAFLFIVLPQKKVRLKVWLIGTLIGALVVTIIQSLAGRLMGLFSGNLAAGVFGPTIVVMLLFNILATLILMTAAWVGTDSVWRAERAAKLANKHAGVVDDADLELDEEAELAAERASRRWAASKSLDDLRRADAAIEPSRKDYVRQDVAAKTVGAGLGIGYGIGAATGLGVGALVVGLLNKVLHRR